MTGQYAGFVVAAYAISAVVLGALTAYVVWDFRRQKAMLAKLEAQGKPRRRAAMGKARAG